MNSNYIIGINENQILATINKITSNIERLDSRFNEIDRIIHNMSNSYNSNSSVTFMKKYDDIRHNYAIIKANMKSYIGDLNNLISNYKRSSTAITDVVSTYDTKHIGE